MLVSYNRGKWILHHTRYIDQLTVTIDHLIDLCVYVCLIFLCTHILYLQDIASLGATLYIC